MSASAAMHKVRPFLLLVFVLLPSCYRDAHTPAPGMQLKESFSPDGRTRAFVWNESKSEGFTQVWLESKGDMPTRTNVLSLVDMIPISLRWEGSHKLFIDTGPLLIVGYQNYHFVGGEGGKGPYLVNVVLSNTLMPDDPLAQQPVNAPVRQ